MLRGRWLVLAFPVGLVLGLAIGVTTGQALPGRLADAGFMTLLGILLAAAIWLPSWMLVSLALALAIVRGAANAGGVGPDTNTAIFAGGLLAAGYIAITLVMALTLTFLRTSDGLPHNWRGVAVRACGSWIAAIGIMLGGFTLIS